jgi:hypothetical protein
LRTGFPQENPAIQTLKIYFTHLRGPTRVKPVYFSFLTVAPLARLNFSRFKE